MKQSEEDFVNEGLSSEELEAISAAGAEPVVEEPEITEEVPAPADPAPEAPGPEKVDIRALQEARASERQLRAELARHNEERARLDERVKMLSAAMQSRAADPEPKAPTFEEDPFGNVEHRLQGTNKQIETLQAELKAFRDAEAQRAQQVQLQQERQAVVNRAQMVANKAAEKHPDVNDAVQHVVNASVAELRRRLEAGLIPPEHYEEAVHNHFTALCSQAPDDPDQFADYIRRHARYWDWQGAKTPAAGQQSVQELAARQERHQSLSGTSGGEAPQPLDAKALATMSDKDFKALMNSVQGRKQVEQIMGG